MTAFAFPNLEGGSVPSLPPVPGEKIIQRISRPGLSDPVKESRMADADTEWVLRSQQGDATAFEELVRQHQRMVHGLFSLLPLFGLPFAAAALWTSVRIRRQEKLLWNAAKPCRLLGAGCAAVGTIAWFLIVTLIVLHAVSNNSGSSDNSYYGYDGD
jgi:hypothetical protein